MLGHAECVRILLKNKDININHQADDGETALTMACLWGKTDVVRRLLEHDSIDTTIKSKYGGDTALDLASRRRNNTEIVQMLQEHTAKKKMVTPAARGHALSMETWKRRNPAQTPIPNAAKKPGVNPKIEKWVFANNSPMKPQAFSALLPVDTKYWL